jgi:hypothetical protein
LEAYRATHGESGLDAIARLAHDWPFLSSLLDNAEMSLAKADMGVARLYAALATGAGDDRRWDVIETEYRRTVSLLARVTGRERLLDGSPVLQRSVALRNPYVDSLSELQVRLLGRLRAARALLLDNHRVELVGVELPFAAADSAAEAARLALDALDFTVPAWFMVKAEPGWEAAFDVLAQDGAESVALYLPPPSGPEVFAGVATVLRALIDRELAYAITDGIDALVTTPAGHGLLNLLGATRAALNGAETAELAAILAETQIDPLASAMRRMSEADAATVRAFLPTVSGPSIRALVEELEVEGLIEPDAA